MTRVPRIDRDRARPRRLLGLGALAALFLISGLLQPLLRAGSLAGEVEARRSVDASPVGDADADADQSETESESQPSEDAPSGRDSSELGGNVPSARLMRQGLFALPTAIAPEAVREAAARPTLRPGQLNPSPRPSGRALRHWLQSQIC